MKPEESNSIGAYFRQAQLRKRVKHQTKKEKATKITNKLGSQSRLDY